MKRLSCAALAALLVLSVGCETKLVAPPPSKPPKIVTHQRRLGRMFSYFVMKPGAVRPEVTFLVLAQGFRLNDYQVTELVKDGTKTTELASVQADFHSPNASRTPFMNLRFATGDEPRDEESVEIAGAKYALKDGRIFVCSVKDAKLLGIEQVNLAIPAPPKEEAKALFERDLEWWETDEDDDEDEDKAELSQRDLERKRLEHCAREIVRRLGERHQKMDSLLRSWEPQYEN
ncbi:MAG: hypothetical protein AAF517_17655 [Planctomycetota bacterium]